MSSTEPLADGLPPVYDLSEANKSTTVEALTQVLGAEHVDTRSDEIVKLTSPPWASYPESKPPFARVLPGSTEDTSQILNICNSKRIPVIPFCGGTGLDGAVASTRGGVMIDFARMDKIIAVHERDLDVVVQPAVGWMNLNKHLESTGLWLPVDPAPDARIGGMIAVGCSGTNAYRYSPMKAWVLGMTVVLADGTIVRTRHRPRKSSAGYDLTSLIVGSSGTLGLVTEATLRLTARPINVHVAIVPFPTLHQAVDTVIQVVERGMALGAIELLDDFTLKGVNLLGRTKRTWDEKPTLFLKFDGPQNVVDEQVTLVKGLANDHGSLKFLCSNKPEEVEELWNARKDALPSLLAMKKDPDDTFMSSDVAVPISRMADLIKIMKEKSEASGLHTGVVGHVGDGNFHFFVLYSKEDEEAAWKLHGLSQKLAVEMEGTVTGEHGIGLLLRDALQMELGDPAIDMMRRMKFALDPRSILNPDKIVRIEDGV